MKTAVAIAASVLVASMLLPFTAFARTAQPKFARLASLAYAIHCQVAEVTADAKRQGIDVKAVTGSLSIKRTTKNSRQLGIKATVPFEIFEFGPELSYTRSDSAEYGVAFDLSVNPSKPVPARCHGYMVPTYYANGRPAGSAALTELVKLSDIYRPARGNDAKPGEYSEAVTFTSEAKVDTGFTIKILFFKVSVSPKSKALADSTGYSVKFSVKTEPFQR